MGGGLIMERVKKGEEYWFIDRDGGILWRYEAYSCQDDMMFDCNNYFHTKEEVESMVRKIRAVFKGAEVIEMSSEDELRGFVKGVGKVSEETAYVLMKYYRWLKSKIVK